MRTLFTIFFLSALTIGALFLLRVSLTDTLIAVDIEELARHSISQKAQVPKKVQPTYPTIKKTPSSNTENTPITTSEETVPAFKEIIVPKIKQETHAPPPLKKLRTISQNGTLTIPGVVSATNAERQANGFGILRLNSQLSAAAASKVQDMFDKQYFEHVGPDGIGPSDWVDATGYEYKLTGENLALGDFSGDIDLVTAWMNSPGHKANILKPAFTEIGVAVGKGMFEGQEVWLAVQVFGKPMPICTPIDEVLKISITENQNLLEAMNGNLLAKKKDIESGEQTQADVDTYNALVAQYNTLIGTTESLVETYNTSIQVFNTCMAQ